MRHLRVALGFVVALMGAIPARAESPRDMVLELKFGPFRPSLDSEFGGRASPFKDIMGSGSVLMTQVEYDYEFYNRFGVAAVGATFGYARNRGKARLSDGQPSNDPTTFHLIPLSLSAVYRFDYLAERYRVPFVPHLKAGFDYYIWWITNAEGKVARAKDGAAGQGGTFGGHVTFGMAFHMDFLAPDMAQTFDTDVGVNNTYLFAEYLMAWVNDFGSSRSFDLSSRTFLFGIAFEF